MSLDATAVEKIAHLARLTIADQALEGYATELSRILDLVEQMSTVDTNDVEPMAHPLHMAQRLRPDRAVEPDQRDGLQRLAPLTENGLYLVPRVIE